MRTEPLVRKELGRRLKTVVPWMAALSLALSVHAAPRSSANYSVATDSADRRQPRHQRQLHK